MKYEFAIAVNDENGLRKKEGDIVSIRPHPFNWGRKEIDQYLILIIDYNSNLNDLQQKLMITYYKDGIEPIYNEKGDMINNPVKLAKNRFNIPLTNLKSVHLSNLDLIKVQNKSLIYQPCKSATQLVQKFDGLNNNKLLDKKDVDCVMPGTLSIEEKIITWTNGINLIKDKLTDKYINEE